MKFAAKLSHKSLDLPHYKWIGIFRRLGGVERHEIRLITDTELYIVTPRKIKKKDKIHDLENAFIEGGKVENGSAKAEGFYPIYRQCITDSFPADWQRHPKVKRALGGSLSVPDNTDKALPRNFF